jgi:hypothetical protein
MLSVVIYKPIYTSQEVEDRPAAEYLLDSDSLRTTTLT